MPKWEVAQCCILLIDFIIKAATLDRGEWSYENDSVLYGNWELTIMVNQMRVTLMKNGNRRENKCSGKYFAYIISPDAVFLFLAIFRSEPSSVLLFRS
jgi:hypothetical protein